MQTNPTQMTTLSGVLEKLLIKKYDNEFTITPEDFTTQNGKIYTASDLKIIRTYRFEGESNPSDSSILLLIEANDGLTGYTIDAYGAYSNHEDDGYDELIKNIEVTERDEQLIFSD